MAHDLHIPIDRPGVFEELGQVSFDLDLECR